MLWVTDGNNVAHEFLDIRFPRGDYENDRRPMKDVLPVSAPLTTLQLPVDLE